MEKYNIAGKYLEFEITETAAFDSIEQLHKLISDIHSLGASASMDDFGSGNTSLNILSKCDFDIIKLDKSFFRLKTFDDHSKHVIKTIIELSHNLNKVVVAEGVENKEIVDFLKKEKCDIVQGYYFSKPMPLDDYLKYIKKGAYSE